MKRIQSSRLASVGIIIFDVDGLKLLNDTLGHAAGDALLVAGADVIKRCFRSGDMVARIGGDEFIVLLPNSDMASIETGCERVQKEIELYNEMSGKLPLSISIGYAVGYDVKETANLLKEADHHLYREKLYRKGNFHNHIIKTLVGTLKVKDFFSQGHAQRLTFWAEEFSFKRKLDASIRKNLRLLAQYHDIGKVGVSDGPLFKDGVLTHDEEKEVERHCEIGHRIALSAPGLVPVADMILKHHEWWNGEGYPLGLQGEAIPFECRVFSIIDAFEAMTSDRPYRRAMSITRSVQELKRYSGLQFDPGLVNEFVHFMNR